MALPPLLFAGVPGGLELLVVLFVFFLLFGVPLTLLVALGYKHLKNQTSEAETARIEQLEAEVADLRERLESTDGGTDAPTPATESASGQDQEGESA